VEEGYGATFSCEVVEMMIWGFFILVGIALMLISVFWTKLSPLALKVRARYMTGENGLVFAGVFCLLVSAVGLWLVWR
jgi:hypothetical membrane protein